MPRRLLANRPIGLLGADLTNVATSLTLQAGQGARFSSPGAGQRSALLLCSALSLSDPDTATVEIVWCSARATDTFTITRGQEGTSGVAWTAAAPTYVFELGTKDWADSVLQRDAPESISGPFTFADAAAVVNGGAVFSGQSSAVSDPVSSDLKQFTKLVTSIAPIPLPFLRDGLGATNRVPEWLAQIASWPTHGSWHLSEFDINGVFRGYGVNALVSNVGTKSSRAMTTGSFRGEATPLSVLATAAATNAAAYFSQDVNVSVANSRSFWRGSVAGRGGFIVSMLFDFDTIASATGRFFAGLTGSTIGSYIGSADVAAGDQSIGLGFLDADNNLYIIGADGTNLAKVPLTTTRDRATATGRMYWLLMMATPNGSGIWVYVVEFTSSSYAGTVLFNETMTAGGSVINGVTPRIPTNTSLMRQICTLSTGTGSVAQKLALVTGLAWTPR